MVDGAQGGFEYPDEAGYPDGTGTLSETQRTLIAEVDAATPLSPGIDFYVVDDAETRTYEAVSGDTLIGGITYARHDDVVTLIATSVYPEFRGQGVATALIERVLEIIRASNQRIRIHCPIVRTFVEQHDQYRSLVVTG
ncbi:GNAT family N-acetyltransferase [Leifsonia sp. NPDC077715]|uniref:GNAT family N-acetyltransferase n=1 Tax=Leifsonia sp. NPDC077715 TaxID=3155539 RepID=UPI0034400FEB